MIRTYRLTVSANVRQSENENVPGRKGRASTNRNREDKPTAGGKRVEYFFGHSTGSLPTSRLPIPNDFSARARSVILPFNLRPTVSPFIFHRLGFSVMSARRMIPLSPYRQITANVCSTADLDQTLHLWRLLLIHEKGKTSPHRSDTFVRAQRSAHFFPFSRDTSRISVNG